MGFTPGSRTRYPDREMILWLPLCAVLLHIFEEFVWPGGFADWDRAHRPALRSSITPRFHVIMNGLLILLCLSVVIDGPTRAGVALWLTLAALLASNALWHAVGTWRTRRYSPGLVTGVLLYLPLACWGFVHFVRSGGASWGTAAAAAVLGGSYHLWAAGLHGLRARRT